MQVKAVSEKPDGWTEQGTSSIVMVTLEGEVPNPVPDRVSRVPPACRRKTQLDYVADSPPNVCPLRMNEI
jgi:hypothetical protein